MKENIQEEISRLFWCLNDGRYRTRSNTLAKVLMETLLIGSEYEKTNLKEEHPKQNYSRRWSNAMDCKLLLNITWKIVLKPTIQVDGYTTLKAQWIQSIRDLPSKANTMLRWKVTIGPYTKEQIHRRANRSRFAIVEKDYRTHSR